MNSIILYATAVILKVNVRMNNYLLEGLVDMANGHFFKGIKTMITGGK